MAMGHIRQQKLNISWKEIQFIGFSHQKNVQQKLHYPLHAIK